MYTFVSVNRQNNGARASLFGNLWRIQTYTELVPLKYRKLAKNI